MTRKKNKRTSRPKPSRHAVPHSETITLLNHHTDSSGYSALTSVVDRERSFVCPSSITRGDFKNPNPWYFYKTGINHSFGELNVAWPTQWVSPSQGVWQSGWVTWKGALRRYFSYDGFNWNVDNDHSRVTDASYGVPTYNKALSRLYDEVRKTDLNAVLSTYELRELRGLRGQMQSSVGRFVKTFRHVIPSASLLAAGGWLTYSYVIKPALNDISAMLNFTGLLTDEYLVKASASEPFFADFVDGGVQERHVFRVGNVKTKFVVAYRVKDAVEYDAWRLGMRSPASFLHESIPFSFVLDWVFNVGSYLSSLEAAYGHGLDFLSGFYTTTGHSSSISTWDSTFAYESSIGLDKTIRQKCAGQSWVRRSERNILGAFPGPQIPTLDLDLASQQLLSAASLLRTLGFGGR